MKSLFSVGVHGAYTLVSIHDELLWTDEKRIEEA
jgi:hypothetical protein